MSTTATTTEKPVFDACRYHTDQRPYKVVGGSIAPQGIAAAWRYLCTLSAVSIDGRTTEKSYSDWLDQVKSDIGNVTSSSNMQCYVADVMYNHRMYFGHGTAIGAPAQGHDVNEYRSNMVTWLGKCLTLFKAVKAFRAENPATYARLSDRVLDQIGNDWLVTGKGEYVGTYPKRLAKALFKSNYPIRLQPEHLRTIGDLISPHVSKEHTEIILKFDQDFIEGSLSGDYCHSGSCWWGEGREGLREGFVAEGGWAIREFDGATPISRCWIVWDKRHACYVLFNSYGKTDLPGFARVLSTAWGLPYAQASLYPDNSAYFINGDKCYLIGPSQVVDKLAGQALGVSWHKPIKPKVKCKCCQKETDSDQLSETRDIHRNWIMVCSDCFETCPRCTHRHTHDAMVAGTGYCQSCRPHLHPCGCCQNLTEDTYCRTCVVRYGLVDRYEVDWDAMTYRFVRAQLPPQASGSVTVSTEATLTTGVLHAALPTGMMAAGHEETPRFGWVGCSVARPPIRNRS